MEILKTVDLSHILDPNELEPTDKSNFKLKLNTKELKELSKTKIYTSRFSDETVVDLCSDYGQYYDLVQHIAESISEDLGIEKRSVEFLKQLGVNTFEQYKYHMTNDLDMINRIVDYTNSFIDWAIKVEPNVYGYHPYKYGFLTRLPDPTEQYINALECIWNKYSGDNYDKG
jgi:hypothetical protein